MSYAQHLAPPRPKAQPKPAKFVIDCFTQLDRFLILGCEGGSYSAGDERTMTLDSAKCVVECGKQDYYRTVRRIVEISESGRAPKNDPAIFALAVLSAQTGPVAACALEALPKVCRIGTHLFQFVDTVTKLRGWGRALRTAVAQWYNGKTPDALAHQVTKYAQREGWSHRDLLRLSHVSPRTPGHNDVFQFVAQKDKWLASKRAGTRMLVMVEEAKTASVKKLCKLIREEGLQREHIPTEHLNNTEIWIALLENMPLGAMLRNLNKMTSLGILNPLSLGAHTVCQALRDEDKIKAARLHPYNVLVARKMYERGRGLLGNLSWTPTPEITAALEGAFYLSFGAVEPTNKRYLFGIDVSGSMRTHFIGGNGLISACTAAGVLAMVGMRTEPRSYAFGFTSSFQDLGLLHTDSLAEVERKIQKSNFGSTNCGLPMQHALKHRIPVDVFEVLTDNDTNTGGPPTRALEDYRQGMGIDAKLVVVATCASRYSVADPTDPGQMDVVGFDSDAPAIIAEFARG